MGFCWVIKTKTKTNPNFASASSSSSDEADPSSSSDEASSSEKINVSISFVLGNLIYNRAVFGSLCSTRLIIGSGSCQACLCNRVGQVDTNPTREPELPTLVLLVSSLDSLQRTDKDPLFINYSLNVSYSSLPNMRPGCYKLPP